MRKPIKPVSIEEPIVEARIARSVRVLATVEGGQFLIDLKQFEPVIAQRREKNLAAILCHYGVSTAEALISLPLLIMSPRTSLSA